MNPFRTLKEIFLGIMYKPAHLAIVSVAATYTLLWGLWLVFPMWSVFSAAPLYGAMSSIAPEISWGSVALVSGAVALWGATTRSYLWTRIGSAGIFWFWLMVGIMYFLGDFTNTGGITALFWAFYGAYIFLNSKLNRELYR